MLQKIHPNIVKIEPQEFLETGSAFTPFLAKIAINSRGAIDIGFIIEGIITGAFPLWVVIRNDEIKAVAVSPIQSDNLNTCMIHVAGKDYEDWTGDLLETIKRWAFENGSERVLVTARLGWEKILKKHGMKKTHVIMEIR